MGTIKVQPLYQFYQQKQHIKGIVTLLSPLTTHWAILPLLREKITLTHYWKHSKPLYHWHLWRQRMQDHPSVMWMETTQSRLTSYWYHWKQHTEDQSTFDVTGNTFRTIPTMLLETTQSVPSTLLLETLLLKPHEQSTTDLNGNSTPAAAPFYNLWEWKTTLQNHSIIDVNAKQHIMTIPSLMWMENNTPEPFYHWCECKTTHHDHSITDANGKQHIMTFLSLMWMGNNTSQPF